jgi:hypothetical protein
MTGNRWSSFVVPLLGAAVGAVYAAELLRTPTRFNVYFPIPMALLLVLLSLVQFGRAARVKPVPSTRMRTEPQAQLAKVLLHPEVHFAGLVAGYVAGFTLVPFVPFSVVFLLLSAAVLSRLRPQPPISWRWAAISVASSVALYFLLTALGIPLKGF